jgi:hypothetical protein
MNTKSVIARLTVIRKNGMRTIVEVSTGATFSRFYRFYRQHGAKRSTKEFVRTASRNEGLPVVNSHLYKPGLDVIEQRLRSFGVPSNPVTRVTLRIIKRRAYKRLLSARPDELGLVKVNNTIKPPQHSRYPFLIGKAIPMAKFNRIMAKTPAEVPA